jgi:hypothetical protein
MQILFRKLPVTENSTLLHYGEISTEKKRKQQKPPYLWALLAIIAFSLIFFAAVSDLENLAPERLGKLLGLYKKFEEKAEQYVLVVDIDGFYACPSCPGGVKIWLKAGEVWKYGVSVNGETGRYSKTFLEGNRLRYKTEFVGSLTECYKMEKFKIFTYPFLPENIQRGEKKLFRPPGNISD